MVRDIMEKFPQTSLIDAKIAFLDIYESRSGIWDHLTDTHKKRNRPLASVALHDCESITDGSDLYNVISRYVRNEIYKEIGLNLVDFLNLPSDVVQYLFKTIEESRVKKEKDNEAILNSLGSKEKKQ
jgi:hypothetical protein